MNTKNKYNGIAPWYDDLAGLVFGQPLFEAQLHFFSHIQPHSKVLILGGGSGWFLPFLFKQQPNIEVWFVDTSEKMISMAKKNALFRSSIHFVNGTLNEVPSEILFNCVILPFFADGFTVDELPQLLIEMKNRTDKKNTIWIVTDFFYSPVKSHQWLLWLTHQTLGRWVSNPNKRLVEWWKVFNQQEFRTENEKSYKKGLIKTILYTSS